MSIRADDAIPGQHSHSDAQGTVFDPNLNKPEPIQLPPDVASYIEEGARKLLKDHPHLQQCHVPAILRLVKLRCQFDELHAQVDLDGVTLTNTRGDVIPNPALKTLATLQNSILAQERQLAISVVAQRQVLTKNEQTQSNLQTNETKRKRGRPPKLRIA